MSSQTPEQPTGASQDLVRLTSGTHERGVGLFDVPVFDVFIDVRSADGVLRRAGRCDPFGVALAT